jgi:glycosyltransferase involved in cell wall biosynthesis
MKILLLSRYGVLGASSRYRTYQYLPYLREQGLEINVVPLLDDRYIQSLYSEKRISLLQVMLSYGKRVSLLLQSAQYDLVWIEKEAFPWVPAWFEVLLTAKVPYVVDYDDAVFHRYDQHHSKIVKWLLGSKIDSVMRQAAMVIAGNNYLAERAYSAGAARVEKLPTVIDLERYPLVEPPKNEIFTIGWIGSPMTSHYLKQLQPVFQNLCQGGAARVVAIGAGKFEIEGVPIEVIPWSESTEVKELQHFDVGIMPLPDSPWEQGKCGFKLIQYMACSRSVVASPIGINKEIVNQGINGFQASSPQEWIKALNLLKQNPLLRQEMGNAGRVMVESQYCLQVTAPKLAQLLYKAAHG